MKNPLSRLLNFLSGCSRNTAPLSFMRAFSPLRLAYIAVVAKQLKSVSRKPVSSQPAIHRRAAINRLSLLLAVVVNMVNVQELIHRVPATDTSTAEGLDTFQSRRVVLLPLKRAHLFKILCAIFLGQRVAVFTTILTVDTHICRRALLTVRPVAVVSAMVLMKVIERFNFVALTAPLMLNTVYHSKPRKGVVLAGYRAVLLALHFSSSIAREGLAAVFADFRHDLKVFCTSWYAGLSHVVHSLTVDNVVRLARGVSDLVRAASYFNTLKAACEVSL